MKLYVYRHDETPQAIVAPPGDECILFGGSYLFFRCSSPKACYLPGGYCLNCYFCKHNSAIDFKIEGMYAYISGKLTEKNPAYVVIDVQGIGYQLHISLNTYSAIQALDVVRLYTHFSVREDAQQLYGFFEEEERNLFLQLISVSGVGANTARVILSSLSTHEAIEAIASGNAAALQRVKGIGAKTAQRIVVDLRDKVGKGAPTGQKTGIAYNTNKEEALSALLILGFNKAAAEKVVGRLLAEDASMAVDKLIREALRLL